MCECVCWGGGGYWGRVVYHDLFMQITGRHTTTRQPDVTTGFCLCRFPGRTQQRDCPWSLWQHLYSRGGGLAQTCPSHWTHHRSGAWNCAVIERWTILCGSRRDQEEGGGVGPSRESPGEIKRSEVELDSQESPGEIKRREAELDSRDSPGEIKRREVELDSRDSPGEIKRREVALDSRDSPGEIKRREVELDSRDSPGEIKRREVELDSQESPGEIKRREVELDSRDSPGEIKRREVELDSRESPGEIKRREVELDPRERVQERSRGGRWSWTLKRVQELSLIHI